MSPVLFLTLIACGQDPGALQLSTGALDLGLIDTTTTGSVEHTVEVQNAGAGPLSVVAVEVVLSDGLTLDIEHGLPLVLAPGETTPLTVEATPTRRGVGEATVRIYSDDTDSPTRDLLLRAEALAPLAVIEGDTFLDYGASCGQGWSGVITNRGDRNLVLADAWADSAVGEVNLLATLDPAGLSPGESMALAFDVPDDWYDDVDVEVVVATNDVFEPQVSTTVETTCTSEWVGEIFWQASGSVDLLLVADLAGTEDGASYVAQLRDEVPEALAVLQASGMSVRLGAVLDGEGSLVWTDVAGVPETVAAEVDSWFDSVADSAADSGQAFAPLSRALAALAGESGFRRPGSSLMLLVLMDAEDVGGAEEASAAVADWSSGLDAAERLRVHGLVADDGCDTGSTGGAVSAAIDQTGGIAGGLCDASYLPWVQGIVDQHLEPVRLVPLPATPFPESLRVRMNSILLPLEYLDYVAPMLVVDDAVEWGPGDYLDIKYVIDGQCYG